MTGQQIRDYRQEAGLTQRTLAAALNKKLGVKLTVPDISRIERGVVGVPENVEIYLAPKIAEKPFANRSDARKEDKWTDIPPAQKKSLKSAIPTILLAMLKDASRTKPLSRADLVKRLGLSGRAVRRTIEELRRQGFRIASDSNGYGYWLCSSETEYKAFRANYLSRAFKQLETAKAMDGYTEGQMEWEEELG